MRIRRIIVGTVVAVIGLPLVVVLIAILWISVLDRTNGRIVSADGVREYLLHVPTATTAPHQHRS